MSFKTHDISSKIPSSTILQSPLPPCGRPLPKNSASRKQSDELLQSMIQKLDRHVAEQRLNRSAARAKILEVIVRETRHFRAQDLVDRLSSRRLEDQLSTEICLF